MWTEKELQIKDIELLLADGYEVEVDSPDGWVGVDMFVHKDPELEHILVMEDGIEVRCAPKHLFETTTGWQYAKDMVLLGEQHILTKDGWKLGKVVVSDRKIPIVDIMVDHPNHRYYTNGVSSHNTGVGKSLAMCHFAAANLMSGYNVLYITLEMAEERIAERIDANLLDFTLDELREVPRDVYNSRISSVMKQTTGKLIVKEYPTSSANVNHFRYLLNELKLKKKFIPDIIYIDYLNICASSRVKMSGSINSYTYIKSIAEEMRGLAVEFNVPIISATQSNRDGANNSDPDLTNTSESWGLPATVDFMVAMVSTEDMELLGQIMFKQLKNRWGDISTNKRFVVGIDRSKMRLTNIDDPTGAMVNDKPAMDNTTFGQKDPEANLQFGRGKFKKQTFAGDFT